MNIKKFLTLSMLCIGVGFASGLGCKTTPEDIAFRSIGVIDITASGAMKGWLDYKNTHSVPQEQIDRVKSAWDNFYEANQRVRVAVVAFKSNTDTNALNRAITIATTASSEVIAVVMQFLPPDKAAALKGVSP